MVNERYNKYKSSYKKYRDNNKDKVNNLTRDWRKSNINKIRTYNKEWNKQHPNYSLNYHNSIEFGKNREIVLERDNWTCQNCGMNNEQHIVIFGRAISIHHKDGKGRDKKDKNNDLNNLITLCLRCHGKEDYKLNRLKRK